MPSYPFNIFGGNNLPWPGGSPAYVAPNPRRSGGGTGVGASGHTAFGGFPVIPNPATTYAEAAAANQSILPQLKQTYGDVNQFNEEQLINQYQMAIPNYDALMAQRSGVLGDMLAGKVSQGTLDLLRNQRMAYGSAEGLGPGSALNSAAYLAGVGRTSEGQVAQGLQGLATAYQTSPIAQIGDPTKGFLPGDEIQKARTAQAYIDAAPDPYLQYLLSLQHGNVGNAPRIGGYSSGGGGGGYGGAVKSPWNTPETTYPAAMVAYGPNYGAPDAVSTRTTYGNTFGGYPQPGDFSSYGDYWAQEPGGASTYDPFADWQSYSGSSGFGDWTGGGGNAYDPMNDMSWM